MPIQLKTNHSEKKRVEAFLHALNEEFEQLPFDWKSMKESTRIVDALKLTNIDKTLTITVIFVESYDDATIIARANFIEEGTRWGQNGSIMYVVESPDQDKVSNAISAFAGKE